jgi:hypothetical protein
VYNPLNLNTGESIGLGLGIGFIAFITSVLLRRSKLEILTCRFFGLILVFQAAILAFTTKNPVLGNVTLDEPYRGAVGGCMVIFAAVLLACVPKKSL